MRILNRGFECVKFDKSFKSGPTKDHAGLAYLRRALSFCQTKNVMVLSLFCNSPLILIKKFIYKFVALYRIQNSKATYKFFQQHSVIVMVF